MRGVRVLLRHSTSPLLAGPSPAQFRLCSPLGALCARLAPALPAEMTARLLAGDASQLGRGRSLPALRRGADTDMGLPFKAVSNQSLRLLRRSAQIQPALPSCILRSHPWGCHLRASPAGFSRGLTVGWDGAVLWLHGNSLAGAIGSCAPGKRLLKGGSCSSSQAMEGPLQTAEGEEAVVFHHHYIPYPCPPPIPAWPGPVQERGPAAVRYLSSGADDGEL